MSRRRERRPPRSRARRALFAVAVAMFGVFVAALWLLFIAYIVTALVRPDLIHVNHHHYLWEDHDE